MKTIKTRADYDRIRAILDTAVDRNRRLPDNVFIPDYQHLSFMDNTHVTSVTFHDPIQTYLTSVGEKGFWVLAIEPDPVEYFFIITAFMGRLSLLLRTQKKTLG